MKYPTRTPRNPSHKGGSKTRELPKRKLSKHRIVYFNRKVHLHTRRQSGNGQLPKMSYSSRPLPSHLRQASTAGGNSASTGQSPILLARINEKKAELENLKQLRDLSAGLAGQMQMLEEKLSTLSDGTEGRRCSGQLLRITADGEILAVATVLGNWHNVLRAISMASSKANHTFLSTHY